MSKRSSSSYNQMLNTEPQQFETTNDIQKLQSKTLKKPPKTNFDHFSIGNLPEKLHLRQKSADYLQLQDVFDLQKMKHYLRIQKNISNFELMELRQIGARQLKQGISDSCAASKSHKMPAETTRIDLIGEGQVRSFFPRGYDYATKF